MQDTMAFSGLNQPCKEDNLDSSALWVGLIPMYKHAIDKMDAQNKAPYYTSTFRSRIQLSTSKT